MPEPSSRRLAAVWFADIVGYTTLSEQDEDRALALVAELQTLSTQVVTAHSGRVVKFVGDAVLAVFESAGMAVDAALALMEGFQERELAREARATLRLGVHVGEIHTAQDGDVYGDGVNTASRIQSAAGPGQVFLSGFALESVRQRANLRTESVGKRRLKGLSRSMELFVVGRAEAGDPRELRFTSPAPPPARRPLRLSQVIAIGMMAGLAALVGVGLFAGAGPFTFGRGSFLPKIPMNENAGVALNLGKASFFRGDYGKAVEDLETSLELSGSFLQEREGLRYLARSQALLGDSVAALTTLNQLLETEPPLAILHPALEDEALMALYMEARNERVRARGSEALSQPLRKIMVFDFHVFAPEVEMTSEGMLDNLGYASAFMVETELGMKGLPVASVGEMSFQEGSYDAYLDLDAALVEMRDQGPSHLIVGSVAIHPRGTLLSAWLYEMETGNLILSEQVTGNEEDLVMKLPETLAERMADALTGAEGGG